jgi:hypothetical protein
MTTTDVITDRHAIADVVNTGLNKLDQLRAARDAARQKRLDAEREEDTATDDYANGINEVLATGWATPQALAAQGHEAPKKRGTATRSKRGSNTDAPEQDPTAPESEH